MMVVSPHARTQSRPRGHIQHTLAQNRSQYIIWFDGMAFRFLVVHLHHIAAANKRMWRWIVDECSQFYYGSNEKRAKMGKMKEGGEGKRNEARESCVKRNWRLNECMFVDLNFRYTRISVRRNLRFQLLATKTHRQQVALMYTASTTLTQTKPADFVIQNYLSQYKQHEGDIESPERRSHQIHPSRLFIITSLPKCSTPINQVISGLINENKSGTTTTNFHRRHRVIPTRNSHHFQNSYHQKNNCWQNG